MMRSTWSYKKTWRRYEDKIQSAINEDWLGLNAFETDGSGTVAVPDAGKVVPVSAEVTALPKFLDSGYVSFVMT